MNTQTYIENYVKLWNECSCDLPSLGIEVSAEEKKKRESIMIEFGKKMRNANSSEITNADSLKKQAKKFGSTMSQFLTTVFQFSEKEASLISSEGFNNSTQKFMAMARKFDPTISLEDIFQASRNLWIINSLQLMMKLPLDVSNATFAYSMLYPYTDNYLDDPNILNSEKLSFSERFRLRLNGEKVIAVNQHEQAIFDLVGLIEGDWDRVKFPKVYESLLAIHDAQTDSLKLLNSKQNIDNLLKICIDKGGTSVMADGYLIYGELTPEQEDFCYGFGVFLQFVDDIQDLSEDANGELETYFTASVKHQKLDAITNKVLQFTNEVMKKLTCFENEALASIEGLMTKSVNFMLIEAIALHRDYFSKTYWKTMEQYSVFSFDFVNMRRNKMDSNRISMMKKMESFMNSQTSMQMATVN